MEYQLEAIGYPLPEDIEKCKWSGDLTGCLSLIDQRLGEDIPRTLREKLELEKLQLQRMARCYTVTHEAAEGTLRERLRDYQPGELERLRRENVIDWILVDGQIRYIDSFYENLVKCRRDIAARQLSPRRPEGRTEGEIRDEVIALMKRDGGAVCRMTLRASLQMDASVTGKLRLWLPYPLERFQMQNVRLISAAPDFVEIAPADAAQRTIFFSGDAERLRRAEIVYCLENHTRYVNPDPEQVSPRQPVGHLEEQLPHIAFTPYLRALTEEVLAGETNPLRKARRIYDFITQKVNYSYMRDYLSLPVIPEYCASRLRGDCGVQALTFITMCRIAGVPAKWQSGLYANENEACSHDWAMFYVAPWGWMFADCSFGGAAWREGNLERWNFYFGNLDPYRVVLASEFQKPFRPASRFLRSDPYDNQRGEAETWEGPLDHALWHGEAEPLSVELLGRDGDSA